MPWLQVTLMSQRKEFAQLAMVDGANMARLCRSFNISRKTGYKWLARYLREGEAGLRDRSRRPRASPWLTPPALEEAVLGVREAHPAWGGRKIRARLQALGFEAVPAASTITAILHRQGCIDPEASVKHKAWQRFEAQAPNDLWQMDFKGHFAAGPGRCHPLTVLDDHSRYALGLEACDNQQTGTVQERLTRIFRRYGLPRELLVDNGSPWGSDRDHPYTPLTVWLLRLGLRVIHARPYHPQTLGKDERFHRTLAAEVLTYCQGLDLAGCQRRFDTWRLIYNLERPHEALGMAVPASRYQVSRRSFPEKLPPLRYGPDDQVRKVQAGGVIFYRNREFRVGKAFRGEYVALRPTRYDGLWEVFFCNQKIAQIDFKNQRRL
ncbi:MAG: IS481 family transposase [Thermodesulfobacteriota bacterium]